MSNWTANESDLAHTWYPNISNKVAATAEMARVLLSENASTDALTMFFFGHGNQSS
jgi:hypothetical protein